MHPPTGGAPPKIALPGVKYLVAVASGKGGVGKSTVAANLALALQASGARVGLHGRRHLRPQRADHDGRAAPSIPGNAAFPLEKYGLKLMSMGFIVNPNQAVIWRGPMVHQAITQFLTDISTGASSITWSSTCRPAPATLS